MSETFKTQASKNDALRDVLDQLETAETEADSQVARECWRKAAVWLRAVLDKPVALVDFGQDFPKPYTEAPSISHFQIRAPDNVPDMAVTVTWPAGRGEMQSVVYDRSGGPDPATLTSLDRRIVRALLGHALDQATRRAPVTVTSEHL